MFSGSEATTAKRIGRITLAFSYQRMVMSCFHKNEISRNYTPADNTPVLFREGTGKMVSLRLLMFTFLIKQMMRRLSSLLNISGLLLRRAFISLVGVIVTALLISSLSPLAKGL